MSKKRTLGVIPIACFQFAAFYKSYKEPLNEHEILRWADHFYKYHPLARNWVDSLFEGMNRPPTISEVAHLLSPSFMLLCYQDYCKMKHFERITNKKRR